ncbi:MAG: hypothetical protein ACOC7N_05030 [Chloroflexota bacterium]
MSTSIEYASFLVRLWRQVGGEPLDSPLDWHSEVEHIQTGECWSFQTLEELFDFLRCEAEDRHAVTPRAGWQRESDALDYIPPRQNSED